MAAENLSVQNVIAQFDAIAKQFVPTAAVSESKSAKKERSLTNSLSSLTSFISTPSKQKSSSSSNVALIDPDVERQNTAKREITRILWDALVVCTKSFKSKQSTRNEGKKLMTAYYAALAKIVDKKADSLSEVDFRVATEYFKKKKESLAPADDTFHHLRSMILYADTFFGTLDRGWFRQGDCFSKRLFLASFWNNIIFNSDYTISEESHLNAMKEFSDVFQNALCDAEVKFELVRRHCFKQDPEGFNRFKDGKLSQDELNTLREKFSKDFVGSIPMLFFLKSQQCLFNSVKKTGLQKAPNLSEDPQKEKLVLNDSYIDIEGKERSDAVDLTRSVLQSIDSIFETSFFIQNADQLDKAEEQESEHSTIDTFSSSSYAAESHNDPTLRDDISDSEDDVELEEKDKKNSYDKSEEKNPAIAANTSEQVAKVSPSLFPFPFVPRKLEKLKKVTQEGVEEFGPKESDKKDGSKEDIYELVEIIHPPQLGESDDNDSTLNEGKSEQLHPDKEEQVETVSNIAKIEAAKSPRSEFKPSKLLNSLGKFLHWDEDKQPK